MLQKLGERIAECLQRADEAERCTSSEADAVTRADREQMAQTWRHLARSYEFVESLERFLLDMGTKTPGPVKAEEVRPGARTPYDLGSAPDVNAILAHTPLLLTRCSSDLRYLFVSQSVARMFNRDADDFVGTPIVDIMGE